MKILNKITSIPSDKLLHFIVGSIISLIISLIFPITESFCLIFAVLAGIGKEIYDKYDYGLFD